MYSSVKYVDTGKLDSPEEIVFFFVIDILRTVFCLDEERGPEATLSTTRGMRSARNLHTQYTNFFSDTFVLIAHVF